MTTDHEQSYRPTCQGKTPADCSTCHLAYDCERARTGRPFAWPIVAVTVALGMAVVAQGLMG